MPLLLLFAFIVVPLLELWVIGEVADVLTLGPTLVLLLVDSILGAWFVRREGAKAWTAFRDAIAAGRVPGDELIEGALLLFGGALLLTPGFLTDALGLALVLPLTRRPMARAVKRRAVAGTLNVITVGPGAWTGSTDRPSDRRDRRGRGSSTAGGEGIEVVSIERDDPPSLDEPPREG